MSQRRKLYINVERIKIKGDPEVLGRYVFDIDKFVAEISSETTNLCIILKKYYQMDYTDQFIKMVENVNDLNKTLFNESEEIFELKEQLLKFIENMQIFNNKSLGIPRGQRHASGTPRISTDRNQVFNFSREDYIYVHKSILRYLDGVSEASKIIYKEVMAAGSIWIDDQYRIFADTVMDILNAIKKGAALLSDYADVLKQKIVALSNR